jgi:hypothetical protein
MIYVRLNSFAYHRARVMNYKLVYTYQSLGHVMCAMRKSNAS